MKDFSLQSTVPVYEPLEAISIVPCDSKLMNICNKDKLKKAKRSRSDPICFLTLYGFGLPKGENLQFIL